MNPKYSEKKLASTYYSKAFRHVGHRKLGIILDLPQNLSSADILDIIVLLGQNTTCFPWAKASDRCVIYSLYRTSHMKK